MIDRRYMSNEEPIIMKSLKKIKEEILKKKDSNYRDEVISQMIDFINIPNFWMEKSERGFVYKKVNDKMLQMIKRERSELVGKTSIEVYGTRLGVIQEVSYNTCFNNEEEDTCFIYILDSMEKELYSYMTVYPYYENDRCMGVVGFLIDMTRFYEEQKELEIGFRNMGFFIWRLDVKNMKYVKDVSLNAGEDIEYDFFNYAYNNIYNEDCDRVVEGILDFIDGKEKVYQSEYRCLNGKGKWIWVRSIAYGAKFDKKGKLKEILGVNIDITDLKRLAILIKDKNQNKFNMMIENIPDIIVKLDMNNKFKYVSDSYCFLVRRSSEEIINRKAGFRVLDEDLEILDKALENVQKNMEDTVCLRYPHNEYRTKIIEWHIGPTYNESGNQDGIIGVGRDVTKRQNNINEMLDEINKDKITELMSKKKIYEVMMDVFSNRGRTVKCVGMIIEIKNMKRIKEILGNEILEEFLIEISEILKENLPSNGYSARISEDEFFIFIENYVIMEESKELMELLIAEIRNSLPIIKSNHLDIEVSGGIAFYPEDAMNHYELLNCANIAKEYAKKEKKVYEFYDSKKAESYDLNKRLFEDIQSGAIKDDISIFYKPIFKLETNNIVGYEPTLSFKNYEEEMEGKLLYIAEILGKSWSITEFKIRKAFEERSKTKEKGYFLLFKIDMKDFEERHIISELIALKDGNILEDNAVLEITGKIEKENIECINEHINILKSNGYRISINMKCEDFGKLDDLNLINFDILKLNIKNIKLGQGNSFNENIIRMVRDFVTKKGREIFIEGISHHEELDFLIQNQFKVGEGIILGKKIPNGE